MKHKGSKKEPNTVEKLIEGADQKGVLVKDFVKHKSWLKQFKIDSFTEDHVTIAEHRYRKSIDELIGPYIKARQDPYKHDLPEHVRRIIEREDGKPMSVAAPSKKVGGQIEEKVVKNQTPPKAKRERDSFGSFKGTGSAAINAQLTVKPKTVEQIAEITGLEIGRVKAQIKWLVERELVVVIGNKVMLGV